MLRINPLTRTDYPDPDVILVDDTYYMISTTMYFMPGGVILRSYDLKNWEIASYVFDKLDDSPEERLEGELNSYGKGMWAACLRYHNGKFYVAFVSHGRSDTHLFISDSIDGPWEHRTLPEYYHDCSILFDDDGRVFVVSGNMNIRLTELKPDLSGIRTPEEGGIDKIIIRDNPDEVRLGYEGSHFYKINGKYVITLIHLPHYNDRRTEAVFMSDTVDGEYTGKDVMWDDMGYHDMGVAQGGLIKSPDNKWYAILFQDSGAVGRIPVLVPVSLNDDDTFTYGNKGVIPEIFFTSPTREEYRNYEYEPLFVSDDFGTVTIKKQWQWNHVPDNRLWAIENGQLKITTDKICVNPLQARNTLTQRMCLPSCEGEITVDGSNLNSGDYIGLIALQGCYGFVGLMREDDKFYIVNIVRREIANPFKIGSDDNAPGEVLFKEQIDASKVRLKIKASFEGMVDMAQFYFTKDIADETPEWIKVGPDHKLRFYLDHFTGARFGLCVYSSQETGGMGVFEQFTYKYDANY